MGMVRKYAKGRRARPSVSGGKPEPNASQNTDDTVVAIGLNCIRCGIPLQIAVSEEAKVLASLKATGFVWLLCMCGQFQLVERKYSKQHD
jgi:hypothetical protein